MENRRRPFLLRCAFLFAMLLLPALACTYVDSDNAPFSVETASEFDYCVKVSMGGTSMDEDERIRACLNPPNNEVPPDKQIEFVIFYHCQQDPTCIDALENRQLALGEVKEAAETFLDELEDVQQAQEADPLTHVETIVESPDCTQSQEGDFFELSCEFTLQVKADYKASTTPAYFFCWSRGRATLGQGSASLELTEPAGTATLALPLSRVRKLYEDSDQNGAADPPIKDEDNMFTNPDPDNDGMYTDLSCYIGETEFRENAAWDGFNCYSPNSDETGECIAPWLSLTEAHTWD